MEDNKTEKDLMVRSQDISIEFPPWIPLFIASIASLTALTVLYYPVDFLLEERIYVIVTGAEIKFTTLIFLSGLFSFLLGVYLFQKKLIPIPSKPLVIASCLYFFGVFISLIVADNLILATLTSLSVYGFPVFYCMLLSSASLRRNHVKNVFYILVLGGVFVAVIGVSQSFFFWRWFKDLPVMGVGSLFYNFNMAGEYTSLLVPLSFALLLFPSSPVTRIGLCVCTVFLQVYLVLTMCRGAWVSLIFGMAFAVCSVLLSVRPVLAQKSILSSRCSRILAAYGAVIPLFLVLIATHPYWAPVFETSISKSSSAPIHTASSEFTSIYTKGSPVRINMLLDSIDYLKDSWLTGVGAGHFRYDMPLYINKSPVNWIPQTGHFLYPFELHNDYIQNWIEIGITGLSGQLLFFAITCIMAFRGFKKVWGKNHDDLIILLGSFGSFAAFASAMMFEFPYRMPATSLIGWLMAGITISISLKHEDHLFFSRGPTVRLSKIAASILIFSSIAMCVLCIHYSFSLTKGLFYKAQAQIALNNRKNGLGNRLLGQAFENAPWIDEIGINKIKLEFAMKDKNRALATANQILEKQPNSLPARWLKGSILIELKKYEEARKEFYLVSQKFSFAKKEALDLYEQLIIDKTVSDDLF